MDFVGVSRAQSSSHKRENKRIKELRMPKIYFVEFCPILTKLVRLDGKKLIHVLTGHLPTSLIQKLKREKENIYLDNVVGCFR